MPNPAPITLATWRKENLKSRITAWAAALKRAFVNGWDTFFTIAKFPFVIKATLALVGLKSLLAWSASSFLSAAEITSLKETLGIMLLPAAPIVISVAIAGVIIYMASAAREEHDRNAEEEEKITELEATRKEVTKVEAHLQQKLRRQIDAPRLNAADADQDDFPDIDFGTASDITLLRYTLLRYLNSLGLLKVNYDQVRAAADKKRRLDGNLHNQNSMLRLIERVVPDLDRSDPQFMAKLDGFLAQDSSLRTPPDFTNRLAIAFKKPELGQGESIGFVPYQKVKTVSSRIAQIFKYIYTAICRGNTGAGVVLWTAVLLLLPITLPLAIAAGVVAALSGAGSVLYRIFVEKKSKQNQAQIKEQKTESTNRSQLLYKLSRIDQKKYGNRNVYKNDGPNSLVIPPKTFSVPNEIKIRQLANVLTTALYYLAASLVIGIAITAVLTSAIFNPLLLSPILLAITQYGAASAGLVGLRYIYMGMKATIKANRDEQKRILEVTKKVEDLKLIRGTKEVERLLSKSKQELVRDLMEQLIQYLASQKKVDAAPGQVSGLLVTKEEKIIRDIEEAAGIKRARVNDLPSNQDQSFYEKLSLYLQEDPKIIATAANGTVTDFKFAVMGLNAKTLPKRVRDNFVVNVERPALPNRLWNSFKAKVFNNRWMADNVLFGMLIPMAVAIPLGFMAFGPLVLLPILLTFAVVMACVVVNKILEKKGQAANLKALADTEAKIPLVDNLIKLKEKTVKQARVKSGLIAKVGEPIENQRKLSVNARPDESSDQEFFAGIDATRAPKPKIRARSIYGVNRSDVFAEIVRDTNLTSAATSTIVPQGIQKAVTPAEGFSRGARLFNRDSPIVARHRVAQAQLLNNASGIAIEAQA